MLPRAKDGSVNNASITSRGTQIKRLLLPVLVALSSFLRFESCLCRPTTRWVALSAFGCFVALLKFHRLVLRWLPAKFLDTVMARCHCPSLKKTPSLKTQRRLF